MNTSKLWEKLIKISVFIDEIVLRYVPVYIGIVGNEIADGEAKNAAQSFSSETLDDVCTF